MEVIREAGRVLRAKSPIEDFEVQGLVIDLSRPADKLAGNATVLTSIDGSHRKVNIEVWGDAWDLANRAMTERRVFACEGELCRATRPFRLDTPRSFRLLPENE